MKAREGSSTPVPETSAARPLCQRRLEEKEGCGEGTKAVADDDIEQAIRSSWRTTGGAMY